MAAVKNGITPVWASEIEAAPISITKRHFPNMIHLGDITKIDGSKIEPVDIITFGSPCQDLSLAGKRKGLSGERSGLFVEAIRIIKEMRGKTNGRYPARIIWENVTGAFSSNEGEDFRIVLEEIASIAGEGFSIPRPPKDGWLSAGTVMGDCYSIAWRVLDAQYWGVPQRRKRIFLVADFRGQCAGEILFKPDGLQGDIAESGAEGEGIAADVAAGFGETGRGYWQEGIQCLRAEGENRPSRPSNVVVIAINTQNVFRQSSAGDGVGLGIGKEGDPAFTLQEGHSHAVAVWPKKVASLVARADGSPCVDRGQPFIYDGRGNGNGKIANTLTGYHQNRITDYTAIAVLPIEGQYAVDVGHRTSRIQMNPKTAFSLMAESGGAGRETGIYCLPTAIGIDSEMNTLDLISNGCTVRRLTPTECERLQGFPDGWTEFGIAPEKHRASIERGKKRTGLPEKILLMKISDSARYKALGNSLAIPCVEFIMRNIAGANP